MREKLKRLSEKCKFVFGYCMMVCLFLGGLTFFGYLAALIIGGDAAVMICEVIYKKIMPIVIYATTGTVLFGLLTMYLAGEKVLTADKKK